MMNTISLLKQNNTLFNVLKAYTLYDNKWGYVQGMNFIAASLIYHSSPDIAFWLFVSLIFDYHLRDNYEAGFPGIEMINLEIRCILKRKCPKLAKLFETTDTDFGMFTLEIIMSLFGITIPLNLTVSNNNVIYRVNFMIISLKKDGIFYEGSLLYFLKK